MHIVIVGHVDHGKSTVIGRLLADTGSLPLGKLEQVRERCARTSKPFEYAFLLDALKDEQAQGITIDSARVFFRSAVRHYIIIDAPGHIEFLKNMVSGAARAEAALLVIDAQEGVRENSRRHGYMLSMLGIGQVAVLVNKMDLVGYSEARFSEIREEYGAFLAELGVEPAAFVPVSGFEGENVAAPGEHMPWYTGPTVLDVLDSFDEPQTDTDLPFRMPVQDAYKFTAFGDTRRIIAGTVIAGSIGVGDEVVFYPSGKKTAVATIETFPPLEPGAEPPVAGPTDAIGFTLAEQLYVNRGQLACRAGQPAPRVATRLKTSIFWLGREPMTTTKEYLLRVGTTKVPVWLEEITRVIDASTLAALPDADRIGRHDVAECVLRCEQPVAFDVGAELPETSRFVLIDDYEISGGGIVHEALADAERLARDTTPADFEWEWGDVSREERSRRNGHRSALIAVTGPGGAQPKDLAKKLERELWARGCHTCYMGIANADDGPDQPRRFAEVADLLLHSGLVIVTTARGHEDPRLDIVRTILAEEHVLVQTVADEQSVADIAAHLAHMLQQPPASTDQSPRG